MMEKMAKMMMKKVCGLVRLPIQRRPQTNKVDFDSKL